MRNAFINYLGTFVTSYLKAYLDKRVFCTLKSKVITAFDSMHNAFINYLGTFVTSYLKARLDK
jgi:hypothetical protein